jgi:hypothetical protein
MVYNANIRVTSNFKVTTQNTAHNINDEILYNTLQRMFWDIHPFAYYVSL